MAEHNDPGGAGGIALVRVERYGCADQRFGCGGDAATAALRDAAADSDEEGSLLEEISLADDTSDSSSRGGGRGGRRRMVWTVAAVGAAVSLLVLGLAGLFPGTSPMAANLAAMDAAAPAWMSPGRTESGDALPRTRKGRRRARRAKRIAYKERARRRERSREKHEYASDGHK